MADSPAAQDRPAPLGARLRSILRSRPVLISGALLILYTLVGFLLLPWLIRTQFPAVLDERLDAQGSIAEVRINPFLLTFEAKGLVVGEKNRAPAVRTDRIFVDFETSSLFRWAWTFRDIRVERLAVDADLDAGGNLNLARLFTPKPGGTAEPAPAPEAQPAAPPRLLVRHFALTGGTFSFTDHTLQPAAHAVLKPLELDVRDVSTLPDRHGDHGLTASLPGGGRLTWKGKLALVPLDSNGTVELKGGRIATLWQFVRDYLTIAEPAGSYEVGLRYRLRYGNGVLDLQAEDLALTVKEMAIADGASGAMLGKLSAVALEGGRFDLQSRSLSFEQVRIADGAFNVVIDQDGEADWAKLVRTRSAAPPASAASAPADAPWKVSLPRIAIGPLALAATDHSRVKPLQVAVGSAEIGLSLTAEAGGAPQVVVENGAVKIGDVQVRSGDDREPLIALGAAEVAGASFDLQKSAAHVDLLRLTGGRTRLDREADGSFNLVTAFVARRQALQESGFAITLERGEIAGHAVTVTDRSFEPVVAYDLEDIRVALSKTALPPRGPFPVELALRVKQGGSLKAKGTVDRVKEAADIQFEARDIALAPLEPVLRRYTTLELASGGAGAAGRITVSGKSNPAALRYRGGASVSGLQLGIESATDRLLSWKRLALADIDFDSGENRLAVARVELSGPFAKLVIARDRSTNFSGIVRAQPAGGGESALAAADKTTAAPMAISIERVSVEGGEVDFTDQSLILPFATNVKGFGGSVSGLSSAAGSRATLKFEGQIDQYGLARVDGAIQPFAPKKFTDIAVAFRNVELTPLTPYSATFAGRKIASGKLSVDLQYKLDNSRLAGDNKLLLDQFTLGEQVESPTAVNLPLDLAIALLTDTEGKIDLAVPVSGNVDNPEFSYGHVIWQAIGTIITRVVTAPFRALGALFGADAEKLGEIVFDPGAARLLPTENEKLKRVAEGLQKRPRLKLTVQPVYHAQSDGLALRTQAVRADLAVREGLKLAPGEDPGPVGFDSAKTQRALESMLNERAGGEAVVQFVAEYRKAAGREVDRVNTVLAAIGRGAGDRELYVAMHKRLVELQPLPDTALADLAQARAAAVTAELTGTLQLDPARVGTQKTEAVDTAAASGVPLKLSFAPLQ